MIWLVLALWILAVPAQAQFLPVGIAAPQSSGGTCAQATTFLSRTSGLSGGAQTAYTTYICGLVTDGVITSGASMGPSGGTPYCGTKLDALWVMATSDSTTARLDICGHTAYTLAPNGAPNFTANQGYVGIDGAATEVWSATQINGRLSGGGSTTATYTGASGTDASVYAETGVSTGKYYWESKITAANSADFLNGNVGHGLGNTSTATADGQFPGSGLDSVGLYITGNGTRVDWYVNSGSNTSYALGITVANGDVFGFALDLANNTLWFRDVTQNSGWFGSAAGGDPATNTSGFSLVQSGFTITASPVVPGATLQSNGDALVGFFDSWAGTPPAGFTGFNPYLNTSFNPATAGGHYTQNSGHLSAWSLTNAASGAAGGVIVGNNSGGTSIQSNIVAKYQDGNAYAAINTDLAAGNATVANADSTGYYMISRTASNLQTLYRNGTSIDTDASASSALASVPIYILARGLPGGSEFGSALRIAIASVGAGLSSGDDTALYTRGCTFLTAVHGSC